mmetsp:Transcript_57175/g.125598  ORF Transcript_57175/g.125598 Transcript_57175/m.125598 type:complete len:231 (-) Transcript_57175:92-784(-)
MSTRLPRRARRTWRRSWRSEASRCTSRSGTPLARSASIPSHPFTTAMQMAPCSFMTSQTWRASGESRSGSRSSGSWARSVHLPLWATRPTCGPRRGCPSQMRRRTLGRSAPGTAWPLQSWARGWKRPSLASPRMCWTAGATPMELALWPGAGRGEAEVAALSSPMTLLQRPRLSSAGAAANELPALRRRGRIASGHGGRLPGAGGGGDGRPRAQRRCGFCRGPREAHGLR